MLSALHHGKRNREDASFAECALDADVASHRESQVARDRQSQSNSGILSGRPAVDLKKGFEDLIEVLGGHANSAVSYPDSGKISVPTSVQANPSAFRCELDRVAKDVQKYLPQLRWIGFDLERRIARVI